MKDFLKQDLSVGDDVVMVAPHYRMLTKGKIIKFTPKKVRVQYINDWNHSKPGTVLEYLSEPEFLVKI